MLPQKIENNTFAAPIAAASVPAAMSEIVDEGVMSRSTPPNRVSMALKQLLINLSRKMERSSSVGGGAEGSYQCYRDMRYAFVFGANKSRPPVAGPMRHKHRGQTIRAAKVVWKWWQRGRRNRQRMKKSSTDEETINGWRYHQRMKMDKSKERLCLFRARTVSYLVKTLIQAYIRVRLLDIFLHY